MTECYYIVDKEKITIPLVSLSIEFKSDTNTRKIINSEPK